MDFEQIHAEIFKDIASSEVTALIPAVNIFYFFPPKDQLSVFPRIHFRIENIKSNSDGDDVEVINEARLVIDIFSYESTYSIANALVKSVLNSKHVTELSTSNDSYEIEDSVYSKHLTFQYRFIK